MVGQRIVLARLVIAAALAALVSTEGSAQTTYYWQNTGTTANDWGTLGNWTTSSTSSVAPGSLPTTTTVTVFSATSATSAQTVNLNADRSVQGLVFSSATSTTLLGGTAARTLTLGSSGISKTGSGAATIGAASNGVAITLGTSQAWNNNAAGRLAVLNNVSLGTFTLTGTGSGTTAITGTLSSSGTLVKAGTGLMILTGSNTFSGGVTVNGGTLAISSTSSLSTVGGTTASLGTGRVTINSGGTLFHNISSANSGTFSNGWLLNGGTLYVNDGATVYSGTVAVTAASTIQEFWGDTQTFSGIMSGTGNVLFQRTPGGSSEIPTFVLSGTNTISGTLTAGAGAVLRVSNTSGLGATSARTVVNSGGALDIANIAVGAEPVTISGTGVSSSIAALNGSTGTSSLSGAVTLAADSTIGGNGTLFTLSGPVSGAFTVTKIGTGVTVLSGTNTYGGVSTVSDGTLRLSNTSAAGTNATIVVDNAENAGSSQTNTLQLSGGLTYGVDKTLILRNSSTSNVSNNRSYLENQSGNNTWAGTIQLDRGLYQGLTSSSGTLTISGSVIQSATASTAMFIRGNASGLLTGRLELGSAQLYKTDGGTWTLASGTNQHGQFVIGNGTVVVAANDALAPASSWQLGEGNSQNTTVRIDSGYTQTFGTIATATNTSGAHTISGDGSLSTGTSSKTITVNDGAAADDLTLSVAVTGDGGLTKAGNGTLVLGGTTIVPAFTVAAGVVRGNGSLGSMDVSAGATLMPGNLLTAGTITTGTLAFGSGTQSLLFSLGDSASDLIAVTAAGGLTTAGTAAFSFTSIGALTTGSTYPLISYAGASPGLGGFAIASLPGHATGSLVDTNSAIGLSVSDAGRVVWTGSTSGVWDTGGVANFTLISAGTATQFLAGDDTLFNDTAVTTTVTVSGSVQPAALVFDNSAVNYTVDGGSIAGYGTMPFTKLGSGTVTLSGTAAHTYTGATTVSAGELAVNSGTSPLSATSGVAVASGATLRLFASNQGFTFSRALSGSGTVVFDTNVGGTAGSNQNVTLSGANGGFAGTYRVAPSGSQATNGTMRLQVTSTAALGSASSVIVESDGQLFLSASGTFLNPISLSGYGYQETAGGTAATTAFAANGTAIAVPTGAYSGGSSGIGALRGDGGATLAGPITLLGTAKISPYNATLTIAGPMTATNPATDDLVIGGVTQVSNNVLTGNNTGLGRIWINGGGGGSTAYNQAVVIGSATGTTGSLGSGDVILYADVNNPILRFQRGDGYTLLAGQNITAAYASNTFATKPQVQVNTLGLGLSVGTSGSNVIDLLDVSGTIGGTFAVANLASGSGAILNIGSGGTVRTRYFTIGEATSAGGTVNQSGGAVVLGGTSTTDANYNLRVGHWGSESSFYNLSGGSITFLTPGSATTPSGGSGSETAGGIYVGIDGIGQFNQSGGDVNTNWVVIDNRTSTSGSNSYTLTGGTLALGGQWGVIGRNPATAYFNWSGGTIRNSGTSLAVAINTPITLGGNATLDTVSSGNTLVLMNGITGSGTITTAGGGIVQLNPDSSTTRTGSSTGTGSQTIAVTLAGDASFVKVGTGTTTLSGVNTYTGATTVSAGQLAITGTTASSAFTITPGAVIAGEGVVGDLTFSPGAFSLPIDASTGGALSAANLTTTSGTITVSLATLPTAAGLIPVLGHSGSYAGTVATDFLLSGSANYRQAVFADSGSAITLDLGNQPVAWSGTAGSVWALGGSSNFSNGGAAESFYGGDYVTFDDTGSAAAAVVLSGTVLPFAVTVSSTTNDYTIEASAGNAIGGGVSLLKDGPSTLTMSGTTGNAYTGGTVVRSGTIRIEHASSLGSGTIQLGDGGSGSANVGLYLQTNRPVLATPVLVSASSSGVVTLGSIYTGTVGGDSNKFQNIILQRDVVFDSNAQDRTDYQTITGTGNVTVTGSGRTIFATTAAYVGNLTVSPSGLGNVQVGVVSGAVNYIPDAAIVTVNAAAGSSYGQFRLSATSETIGALAGNGVVDVNAANGTLTVGGSSVSGTFAGTLQNFGANTLAITKSGTGIQALSGTSTYSGATTIAANGGILRILGQSALSTTSTITISKQGSQGGILQFQTSGTNAFTSAFSSFLSGNPSTIGGTPAIENLAGDNTITRSLTVGSPGGSGLVVESQGGLLTLSGTISNTVGSSTRPLLLGGSGNGRVAGPVVNSTGNSGINKYGTGTWSVTGTANTFTGAFAILEGVLDVASLANTGTASSIGSGGTIQLTGQATSGTLRYSGVTDQTTNRTLQVEPTGGTLESSGAGTLSFTGLVTTAESSAFNLTFASGSNVVTNLAAVAPGTVVGQSFTSPSISGTATITAINGTSYTINTTATASGAALATFVGGNDRTLTLAGSNTGRNTIAGAMGDSSAGGRLGIAKTGPGMWVITGSNTYTGPTTVSAGSFVVDGSIGASAVTIASGATLLGTGTIGGPTSVLGTHSPGGSPGLSTFSAGLSYGSASTLVWELSANTDSVIDRGTFFDGVNLTSGSLGIDNGAALSLVFNSPLASGSASTVDWDDAFWAADRSWKAIGVDAPATWNPIVFSTLVTGSDATGASLASKRPNASFTVDAQADGLYILYSAVPEPTTTVLAVAGVAGMCVMMIRRRRFDDEDDDQP